MNINDILIQVKRHFSINDTSKDQVILDMILHAQALQKVVKFNEVLILNLVMEDFDAYLRQGSTMYQQSNTNSVAHYSTALQLLIRSSMSARMVPDTEDEPIPSSP